MKFGLLVAVLLAATWAVADVKVESVEYQAGDTRLRGSLVFDDRLAGGRPPGVIVFPEWWGANEYAESRARMLAEIGYVAFVADMYGDGKVTNDPAEAKALSGKLYESPRLAMERADAALEELRRSGRADENRIAAIGYCMGGTVALHLARNGADVKTVVAFHAGLASFLPEAKEIKASILVLNGGADKMVSDEETAKFVQEMRGANADWQLVLYGGAMHSFTNPKADQHKNLGTIGYDQQADMRSWRLMTDHLAHALGHKPDALGTVTPTASAR